MGLFGRAFGGVTGSSGSSIVTDTFDRADSSTTLNTASDGVHSWTAHVGTWGIASNLARLVTSAGVNQATVDAGVPDCTITLTLDTVSSTPSNNCGIVFRFVDTSNWWRWITDRPNNDLILQKNVAGSISTVYSNTNIIVGSGDFLRVVLSGASISCYYADTLPNWVLETTQTDSAHQTATRHGVGIGGTTGTSDRLNDFSITT